MVTLVDTTGTVDLSLQATLMPGRNAVTNDTLRVLAKPFSGRGPGADGSWDYAGELRGLDPEGLRGTVEIVAPRVAGVSPTRPLVHLAPIARQGPLVIDVEESSLPVLSVTEPVTSPGVRTSVEWTLEVRPEGEEARFLFGTGLPPRRIPIPRIVLPEGVQSTTEVRLRYAVHDPLGDLPDGAYQVSTFFRVAIGWTLRPEREP